MKRGYGALAALVVAFVLLGPLFLIQTETGARVLVWGAGYVVKSVLGGDLRVGLVAGRLGSRLRLEQLFFDMPGGLGLEAATLVCSFGSFSPFTGNGLVIAGLELDDFRLDLPDEENGRDRVDGGRSGGSAPLLPFPVGIQRIRVKGFTLDDGSGGKIIPFEELTGGIRGDSSTIVVKDLTVWGKEYSLQLSGSLGFGDELSRFRVDLIGHGRLDGFGFYETRGGFVVTGQLGQPHVRLTMDYPGDLVVEGQVEKLLEDPHWSARLVSHGIDLGRWIRHCPSIPLERVQAEIEGDLGGYRGQLLAYGGFAEFHELELTARLDADWMGIYFDRIKLARGPAAMGAAGAWISWRRLFDWHGDFTLSGLDLQRYINGLPEYLNSTVNGSFTSSGTVDDDGVVAEFSGLDLRLERQGNQPGIPLHVQGGIHLTERDVVTGNLLLTGEGLSGVSRVEQARYSWQDQAWAISGRLEGFNPAIFHPSLVGEISAQFTGSGSLPGGDDSSGMGEGAIRLTEISGELFRNVMSGQGHLEYFGEGGFNSRLDLYNGDSHCVFGASRDRSEGTMDLELDLKVADLSSYVPEGSGRLDLRLRADGVGGSAEHPVLRGHGVSRDLRYRDWQLANADLEFAPAGLGGGEIQGWIALTGLRKDQLPLGSGRIDFSGTVGEHLLNTSWHNSFGRIRAEIAGALRKTRGWLGEIGHLDMQTASGVRLQQHQAAKFVLGSEGMQIDGLCMGIDSGEGCVSADLQFGTAPLFQVQGKIRGIPLALLDRLGSGNLPVEGWLDSDFALHGAAGKPVLGELHGWLRQASVTTSGLTPEPDHYRLGPSMLEVSLDNEGAVGRFSLDASSGGTVRGMVRTGPLVVEKFDPVSQPLEGNVRIRDLDLRILSELTDHVLEIQGGLRGDVKLGGNLGQPIISGTLRLDDGAVSVAELGMELRDIDLALESAGSGSALRFSARSGSGSLTGTGKLILQNRKEQKGMARRAELQITGKDFLLVNLPEYRFEVDPRVSIGYASGIGREMEKPVLSITGSVEIPRGVIHPQELSSRIRESADVVYGDSRPDRGTERVTTDLDLQVALGENVRVDGYGLTGSLGGNLRLRSAKGKGLVADGELALVDGRFALYGSSLDIERGRVLFTGGPIGNPGIDVLAVKEVEAERLMARKLKVGMSINGLLQDLQFNLFSDPYMEESLILSYLAVGQSARELEQGKHTLFDPTDISLGIQRETGIGSDLQTMFGNQPYRNIAEPDTTSFGVGKKLGKHLQVNYNVNMYSQQGQFSIRYELQRGFYIETTSSSEASSADLLYVFER